jgi:hypothetical protein
MYPMGMLHAEPPGQGVPVIHVVAIQSDDVDDQADALTAALRSRVRAMHGFSLADGDASLEVLTLGLKCNVREPRCQTKIGDQLRADRYVWGTVVRSSTSKQVVASLHLWTRGEVPTETKIAYSDGLTAPGDEALKRLVDTALTHLVGRAPTSNAAPASSASVANSPSAALGTKAPVVTSSSLSSPEATSSLSSFRVPEPKSSSAPPADEDFEVRSDGRSTAGWAGVGFGGALVAAGVYSVVRLHQIDSSDRYELYTHGFGDGVDPCAKARAGVDAKVPGAASPGEMQDLCSQTATFKALQFVFFGLGAVSAGAGIFLLATVKDEHASTTRAQWTVTPVASRTGGRLELGLTF